LSTHFAGITAGLAAGRIIHPWLLVATVVCAAPAAADDLADAETAYRDGRYETAFELFKPLADKGIVAAEVRLAELYEGKEGVSPDIAKALSIYRRLSDEGIAAGERGLGLRYHYGVGVAKDLDLAVHWLSLAAAHGDALGELDLGTMYLRGEGVAVDPRQGLRWINLAADAGDTVAQYMMGRFCERGQLLQEDKVQALKWYLIAYHRTYGWDEKAYAALAGRDAQFLSLRMSQSDIARATSLAAEWNPSSAGSL